MAQSKVSGPPQTGSITLAEARRAARTVKNANAAKSKTQGDRRMAISKSITERYLGHFGVGTSKPLEKKTSKKRQSGRVRSTAKDTASK
jgi:hypothetical protein